MPIIFYNTVTNKIVTSLGFICDTNCKKLQGQALFFYSYNPQEIQRYVKKTEEKMPIAAVHWAQSLSNLGASTYKAYFDIKWSILELAQGAKIIKNIYICSVIGLQLVNPF